MYKQKSELNFIVKEECSVKEVSLLLFPLLLVASFYRFSIYLTACVTATNVQTSRGKLIPGVYNCVI